MNTISIVSFISFFFRFLKQKQNKKCILYFVNMEYVVSIPYLSYRFFVGIWRI